MSKAYHALVASRPIDIRVIQRNRDGSGVVELPIVSVVDIDKSLTWSKGDGQMKLDATALREFAENFPQYPGPVPAGLDGHVAFEDRAGPQPAFVEGLRVDGNFLIAKVWLSAPAFKSVVGGEYRSFSIEFFTKGIKLPAATLKGHVLVGGTFTNRPAAPVHFRPPADTSAAAEAVNVVALTINVPPKEGGKERTMNLEQKVEGLQAEVSGLKTEIETRDETINGLNTRISELSSSVQDYRAKVSDKDTEIAGLKADLTIAKNEVKVHEGQVVKLRKEKETAIERAEQLQANLDELKDGTDGAKVRELAQKGLAAGMPAKYFEDHETESVAWCQKKYGGLEQFENFVTDSIDILGASGDDKNKNKKNVKPSGRNGEEPNGLEGLSEEDIERMKAAGVNLDFVGVDNAAQFAKRVAELNQKKGD